MEKAINLNDLNSNDFGTEKSFSEGLYYNVWGDCCHLWMAPDPSRAERVDHILTVYRSRISDKIVGLQIKGIKTLFKKYHALRMSIKDGQICFEVMLLAVFHEAYQRISDSGENKLKVFHATYERLFKEVGPRTVELPEDMKNMAMAL